ncbi:helix-turn-helix domain-containing protein [Corynebacterium macginleyi]|uniref:helix-turn-helix domain-containing protein n=2 Tax=Corynebacteriaceae TaxID=1653 RepID=UPI0036F246DB
MQAPRPVRREVTAGADIKRWPERTFTLNFFTLLGGMELCDFQKLPGFDSPAGHSGVGVAVLLAAVSEGNVGIFYILTRPCTHPFEHEKEEPRLVVFHAGPLFFMQSIPERNTMDTTTWLLADEAAEYMRMHRDTVYKLLQRGELRGVKVGKHWRTRSDWCNDYLMGAHA